jgi:hypothetical protein
VQRTRSRLVAIACPPSRGVVRHRCRSVTRVRPPADRHRGTCIPFPVGSLRIVSRSRNVGPAPDLSEQSSEHDSPWSITYTEHNPCTFPGKPVPVSEPCKSGTPRVTSIFPFRRRSRSAIGSRRSCLP